MSERTDWNKPDFAREPFMAMVWVLSPDTRQRLVVKIALGATRVRELAEELGLPTSTVRANLRALESVQIVTKSGKGARTSYGLGEGVSAFTTDTEVVIHLKPPGGGSLELGQPLGWLCE